MGNVCVDRQKSKNFFMSIGEMQQYSINDHKSLFYTD
jgi:hypothetical protein